MKINKTVICIMIVMIIAIAASILPLSVHAAVPANFEKAVDLKILGLLANSPDDFQLDRAPTRLEGAIMLVRLLGKDKLVSHGHYEHPFTDVPGWADNYVGYMYQNKLTTGIDNSRFGSNNPLTAGQYVTFVLRSLGYKDGVDFNYADSMDKAVEKGLLQPSEASSLNGPKKFLRDDMAGISYNALLVKVKDSSQTLLDKLVTTDKAVFGPTAKVLGLYTSDLQRELGGLSSGVITSGGKTAKSNADLFRLIRNSLYSNEAKVTIDVGGYNGDVAKDFEKTFDRALKAIEAVSGVQSPVSSWEYRLAGRTLSLAFEYRYSKNEFAQRKNNYTSAVNKARYIVARQITPNMSDYEKEKVLHDYVINNTVYDYKNYTRGTIPYESYDVYGCLVKGTAVCEGYTQAMKLLCDLSGIECDIVVGKANGGSNEGHSWNIVKIDGAWCHVDLTGDDPVTEDGTNVLTYCYFNLSDSEMAKTNVWDKRAYPACNTDRNSYYYRSSSLANTRNEFDKAILAALGQRSSIIEIKAMDYSRQKYSNLSEVIIGSGNVRSYRYSINDEYGVIRIFNIQYA